MFKFKKAWENLGHDYFDDFEGLAKDVKLIDSALETLAIILEKAGGRIFVFESSDPTPESKEVEYWLQVDEHIYSISKEQAELLKGVIRR